MKWLLLALLSICALPAHAVTRNVTCTGNITSALQSAISASGAGDIVNISAGSCTTTFLGSFADKPQFTIQGQGQGVTNINVSNDRWLELAYNGSNTPLFRITGMSFTGSSCSACIWFRVWANQVKVWRGGWRIDHITLYYPSNSDDGIIALYGPIWGLIDHVNITTLQEAQIMLSTGTAQDSISGEFGASFPYQPGSSTITYIEDSTFTGLSATGAAITDTDYNGGRYVFRHNTTTNGGLFTHWTKGTSWNSVWLEVYNNKFTCTACSGQPPSRLMGGGTGLFYNNTLVNYGDWLIGEARLSDGGGQQNNVPTFYLCDGTHNWDGNTDAGAPGWPCISQVGRDAGKTLAQIQSGDKQPSFPMYVWNNGPQDKCYNPSAGGAACDNSTGVSLSGEATSAHFKTTAHSTSGFGNGDKDYCITASQPSGCGTHTLTYTPYTYPHPLQGGAAAPSAPTNFRRIN